MEARIKGKQLRRNQLRSMMRLIPECQGHLGKGVSEVRFGGGERGDIPCMAREGTSRHRRQPRRTGLVFEESKTPWWCWMGTEGLKPGHGGK